MTRARTRLAVWGDPIAHSRSPQLHAAAYAALGLDWTYDRRQVTERAFADELDALDATWRGLSCTYPLKSAAFAAARYLDERAELTGAVNTLLLGEDDGGVRGFNTDVGGIVAALADDGFTSVATARIVGAGATATSALVALSEMGADRVEVAARRPEAAESLSTLGERLGVSVHAVPLGARGADVDVTIATLPGDAAVSESDADVLASGGGTLLDVVYGHWPTALASAWVRAGAPAMDGLGMLLHQALLQVRIFATGDVTQALPDEASVLSAMRAAVTQTGTSTT